MIEIAEGIISRRLLDGDANTLHDRYEQRLRSLIEEKSGGGAGLPPRPARPRLRTGAAATGDRAPRTRPRLPPPPPPPNPRRTPPPPPPPAAARPSPTPVPAADAAPPPSGASRNRSQSRAVSDATPPPRASRRDPAGRRPRPRPEPVAAAGTGARAGAARLPASRRPPETGAGTGGREAAACDLSHEPEPEPEPAPMPVAAGPPPAETAAAGSPRRDRWRRAAPSGGCSGDDAGGDAEGRELGTEILLHIMGLGDRRFVEPGWAGHPGSRRQIEAMSIRPRDELEPSAIEFRVFAQEGRATAWVSNGNYAGTRGRQLPLTGFAVRPGARTARPLRHRLRGLLLRRRRGRTEAQRRDLHLAGRQRPARSGARQHRRTDRRALRSSRTGLWPPVLLGGHSRSFCSSRSGRSFSISTTSPAGEVAVEPGLRLGEAGARHDLAPRRRLGKGGDQRRHPMRRDRDQHIDMLGRPAGRSSRARPRARCRVRPCPGSPGCGARRAGAARRAARAPRRSRPGSSCRRRRSRSRRRPAA